MSQSESSWSLQKAHYEDELSKVQARIGDYEQQNQLLHTHLDQLSKQLITLQSQHSSTAHLEVCGVV